MGALLGTVEEDVLVSHPRLVGLQRPFSSACLFYPLAAKYQLHLELQLTTLTIIMVMLISSFLNLSTIKHRIPNSLMGDVCIRILSAILISILLK